jgi:hypothetical protein
MYFLHSLFSKLVILLVAFFLKAQNREKTFLVVLYLVADVDIQYNPREGQLSKKTLFDDGPIRETSVQ